MLFWMMHQEKFLLQGKFLQEKIGLLHKKKAKVRGRENAEFVIDDLNKETAEVFSKLKLGMFIPNSINFLIIV